MWDTGILKSIAFSNNELREEEDLSIYCFVRAEGSRSFWLWWTTSEVLLHSQSQLGETGLRQKYRKRRAPDNRQDVEKHCWRNYPLVSLREITTSHLLFICGQGILQSWRRICPLLFIIMMRICMMEEMIANRALHDQAIIIVKSAITTLAFFIATITGMVSH